MKARVYINTRAGLLVCLHWNDTTYEIPLNS